MLLSLQYLSLAPKYNFVHVFAHQDLSQSISIRNHLLRLFQHILKRIGCGGRSRSNRRCKFTEELSGRQFEGNTRCLRVELEVLVLSPSQYSTSVETHSLIAWQTSLIVGRSEISRQVLRRIVSCSSRGHLDLCQGSHLVIWPCQTHFCTCILQMAA